MMSNELTPRQGGSTAHFTDWDVLRHQAKTLVDSGLMPPAVNTWQKATVLIMYGKELGMGPMEAIQSIDVIQGKPTQKPQSMKARVHQKLPGAIFRPVKLTDDEAVFEAARPGDPPVQISFTAKDAEQLGYLSKDNWKKQRSVMLQWRCIAKVARLVFPDCLSGISYTPEELGAEVDDEHNVISVEPERVQAQQQPTVDIKKINAEADAAKEAEEKKQAIAMFMKKREALTAIGWKPEDFAKKLNVTKLDEILLKDSKTIYAALEVLQDET
jgi:hypothetical protein